MILVKELRDNSAIKIFIQNHYIDIYLYISFIFFLLVANLVIIQVFFFFLFLFLFFIKIISPNKSCS